MEPYRDIHNSNKNVEKLLQRVALSAMSKKQKAKIVEFIRDLRIGKAGKKVRDKRISNYLQFLFKLDRYFKKDLELVSEQEATDFYVNLQDNKIRRDNGLPYAETSKDEFVKTLKRYLGWAWGGNHKVRYKKSISWMKENYRKSEKHAISLEEARKVERDELKIRNKCLFMFLFDSGARIEEALNVRISDLSKSKDNSFYLVHLRGTKTEEADRKISMPLCTDVLNEWIQAHPSCDPSDLLFPIRYDNSRKIIKEISFGILGKTLKPHELRHSSATYYVTLFGAQNIAGFYYRYGWKFGSKEANTYIKRNLYGGDEGQKKIVDVVVSSKIVELEDAVRELKKELDRLKKGKGILELLLQLSHDKGSFTKSLEKVTSDEFDVVLEKPEQKLTVK